MNGIGFNVNILWLYAVLFHVAGSVVFSTMVMLPFGFLLSLTGLWVIAYFLSDKTKKARRNCIMGWLLMTVLLTVMPIQYHSSFLMNGLMALLIYEVCHQRQIRVTEYCQIRKIPFHQWGMLLLLTAAMFIVAAYVNAISMLFVHNMTTAALSKARVTLVESLLVYALIPAIIEELLFRGCIFRGIGKKKKAILISSLLFALLHMNFNQMSYALLMGVFLALLVAITDNLSVSIVVHVFFNSINILLAAFAQHPIVQRLTTLQVAGYNLLSPNLVGEDHRVLWQNLRIGTVIVLGILCFVSALLYLWYKKDKNRNGQEKEENIESKWKPDGMFWAGCVVCLLIAVSSEIFW